MRPRRRSAAVCLLLAFAALLANCRATTSAPSSPTTTVQPTAAVTVNRANLPPDTLRWSLEGVTDLTALDPARSGDNATVTVVNFIFGGLVRLDERLEVQPNDAETWTTSEDGRTYTFRIRQGLTFANGDPVSASDYAYSINRAMQPQTGSFGAPTQLANIIGAQDVISGTVQEASGVRALDERTLEIELSSPSASFLQQLTFPYTYVVPRSLVESGDEWVQKPYGTGPYVVKEWKRGESILLEANANYWQGKPGVPFILIPFSRDSVTAYNRYLAGELDIMGSLQNPLPAALLPDVRGLPDFRTSPALNTRYVGFNNRLPPFDNDGVRRAFAMAVDKQHIADVVLHGEVFPASRILPPGMVGTQEPIKRLPFDPEMAKAELAKAGFPDGTGLPPVTLTYAPEGGENELVVQALKRDWQTNLGITVELQPLETTAFSAALDTTRNEPQRGLQMYYSVWGADYPDPQNFLSLQLESSSNNNNGHFSDVRFDRLVAEADQIGDRSQIRRRLLLYNQAEQIAIDRVGWLPILHSKVHLLIQPRVAGLIVTPNGLVIPDWSKLGLSAS